MNNIKGIGSPKNEVIIYSLKLYEFLPLNTKRRYFEECRCL